MIGKTLSHYRIIEKIGEGGMSIVYKAEDVILQRTVAVKILPSFASASLDERTRFTQEARLASGLNHPNILTVHEFSESEGTAFLVTECVDGRTLTSIIKKEGLPLSQLFDLAIQIASGIAEAHSHNIVHRDIKPDNIMVSFKGQAKVMDFGLARLMGSSHVTVPGSLVGTFAYMSPEQIDDPDVDARSDIFSFGTLLYQMVTGEIPFRGKTVAEMLSAIIRKKPEPLSNYRSELPPGLEQIIFKAIEKDPVRRYQSVDELKAHLEQLRDGQPVALGSTSRLKMIGSAAAVVALCGVLAYMYFFPDKKTPPPVINKGPSIAVMPFQNVTQDSSVNFLQIGLADYIITRLTYIRSLTVKPTSSIAPYEGKIVDVVEAGADLQADYVLEGRFQKINDQLTVNTQLVDVYSTNIVWADKVHLLYEDIATIQDAISERIAEALEIKLSESERTEVHKLRTKSPEAFEYYLRGVALTLKGSRENNRLAIKMFEQSASIDRQFAEAYAGLSFVYAEQFWSNYSTDTAWVGKAEQTARTALSLNPLLGTAHSALGFALRIKGYYRESLTQVLKALTVDPYNSFSLEDIVEFYRYRGEFDTARKFAKRAHENDPSFNIYRVRARIFQFEGKYQESVSELEAAIQQNPNDAWLRGGMLAYSYIRLGNFVKAEEEIQLSEKIDRDKPEPHLSRAMLATLRGNVAVAHLELDRIDEYVRHDYALAGQVAAIYARQNNVAAALQWMERSILLGNRWYHWYKTDPWFDSVRENPKFKTMLNQIKEELDVLSVDVQKQGY